VKESEVRRGIVLMGPRRIGKTIMIYHAIERLISDGIQPQNIIYLSIDTPIYNGLSLEQLLNIAKRSLAKSSADEGLYVFYDEVQYLKDWELHLKSLVDTYRSTRFIVSGSAAAALRMKSDESGAGRFHDFTLPPLSFNEYIHLQGLGSLIVPKKIEWNKQEINAFDTIDMTKLNEHFIRYINYGGYPEVVFSKEIQKDPGRYMRRDIVDKVMLKDLPSLYGISDTQELYRLFIHIAYRSGNEFSYEDMSQESGIRKDVIRKYLNYL
jgi:predicted AAA+ superfamily ATPase